MTDLDPLKPTLRGLQEAAAQGALSLVYQPKLDLRSRTITAVEALARWQHPTLGAISPSAFIPATEQSGLIDWFTEWALITAASEWVRWRSQGLDLDLAVNISALNLAQVRFPDRVRAICEEHGLPPERLTLELTEGATQDATRLMDTVTRLRLKGFEISLDDFGTGFGSLVQLRSLPFTELKVDQRFVSDLLVSKESRAITRGLITMAHEIGLSVTAEGVEDAATLQALQVFGCDKAQGFLISHPLAGNRFVEWMVDRSAEECSTQADSDWRNANAGRRATR